MTEHCKEHILKSTGKLLAMVLCGTPKDRLLKMAEGQLFGMSCCRLPQILARDFTMSAIT